MNGIAAIARNAGTASPASRQSMSAHEESIMYPTIMSAGAVAKPGIARNTGAKTIASAKSAAEVRGSQARRARRR